MTDPGSYPFVSTIESTAYHEAGHAAVALHLGSAFRYVSIVEDDDSLGHVRFLPPGDWFRPDIGVDGRTRNRVERTIQIGWGGPEAEARYRGFAGEGGAMPGSESDISHIVDLSVRMCGSAEEAEAYAEWLRIRTKNILRMAVVWSTVDCIARRLIESKRLSYRAVRAQVAEHREVIYREVLERAHASGKLRPS